MVVALVFCLVHPQLHGSQPATFRECRGQAVGHRITTNNRGRQTAARRMLILLL